MSYIKTGMITLFTCLVTFCATGQKYDCYEFLKKDKSWRKSERPSDSTKKQLFLLGIFHFNQTEFEMETIKKQVLNFNPEAIFTEQIPPEAPYREKYYNARYKKDSLYTKRLSSLVNMTNISRKSAPTVIENNYKTLEKDPDNMPARVELANALLVNMDEQNGLYNWGIIKQSYLGQDAQTPFPDKTLAWGVMGETQFFSIPIAQELGHSKLYHMDYQMNRDYNDSLLQITQKKAIIRMAVQIWKWPKMIKLVRLQRKSLEKKPIKLMNKLNNPKLVLGMSRLYEREFRMKNVEASLEWNKSYIKRNYEMVNRVLHDIETYDLQKSLVVVGAGHLPYFIWQIKMQNPEIEIRLLNRDY